MNAYDYLMVGGGLQNSLIAMALLERRPGTSVAIVESGERLGGNHVWCFHDGDVAADDRTFVDPLVSVRHESYDVLFPDYVKRTHAGYHVIESAKLHDVVARRIRGASSAELFLRSVATDIGQHRVTLADGKVLEASLIIDGRGPTRYPGPAPIGYQKFLGMEFETDEPFGLRIPRIMDARVPQEDDMRFVYVLPLSERRLLVEDTYYSESGNLDASTLRSRVLAYASSLELVGARVVREETGVLPLPAHPTAAPYAEGPLAAGYRGGFFHPTTGYSLPAAVRLASYIASRHPTNVFGSDWSRLHDDHRKQAEFFCLLNRMMFKATERSNRFRLLERCYRLPESTLARFYSMSMSRMDRARVLCGRPPKGVSIFRAFKEMWA